MTQQTPIRISEPELRIDKDEPFQSDLLGRKPSCALLTDLANCVDGPCTIAIDAGWGYGKTTFLQLWAAHLKQDAFLVINVNAWETDYFDNPFLAIVGEMTIQIKACGQVDVSKQSGFSRLVKSFAKVVSIAPRLIEIPFITLTGEDVAEIISSYKTDASIRLEQYEEQLASVKAFRSELESVAREVRLKTKKPLVVLVDELDRCRPTYAVEFLEVIKHLMTVDNVVYAFAMNRSELAQTVSGCYGPKFDGKGYLRRFIDVDFTLPEPSRQYFITFLLEEQLTGLITNQDARGKTARLLHAFLDVEWISLRQIQQALYRFRLALVLAQQDIAEFSDYAIDFCTALILRVYDPDILGEFLRGELSDQDVVERTMPSKVKDNPKLLKERLWFESAIVMANQEITGQNQSTGKFDYTRLYKFYKDIVESSSTNHDADQDRYFAGKLVERIENPTGEGLYSGRSTHVPRRFKLAASQLEMMEQLKTTKYS